jgi:hypothetical protein
MKAPRREGRRADNYVPPHRDLIAHWQKEIPELATLIETTANLPRGSRIAKSTIATLCGNDPKRTQKAIARWKEILATLHGLKAYYSKGAYVIATIDRHLIHDTAHLANRQMRDMSRHTVQLLAIPPDHLTDHQQTLRAHVRDATAAVTGAYRARLDHLTILTKAQEALPRPT